MARASTFSARIASPRRSRTSPRKRYGLGLAASAFPAATSDACASASSDASRYIRPTESITVASRPCHCSPILPTSRTKDASPDEPRYAQSATVESASGLDRQAARRSSRAPKLVGLRASHSQVPRIADLFVATYLFPLKFAARRPAP